MHNVNRWFWIGSRTRIPRSAEALHAKVLLLTGLSIALEIRWLTYELADREMAAFAAERRMLDNSMCSTNLQASDLHVHNNNGKTEGW